MQTLTKRANSQAHLDCWMPTQTIRSGLGLGLRVRVRVGVRVWVRVRVGGLPSYCHRPRSSTTVPARVKTVCRICYSTGGWKLSSEAQVWSFRERLPRNALILLLPELTAWYAAVCSSTAASGITFVIWYRSHHNKADGQSATCSTYREISKSFWKWASSRSQVDSEQWLVNHRVKGFGKTSVSVPRALA